MHEPDCRHFYDGYGAICMLYRRDPPNGLTNLCLLRGAPPFGRLLWLIYLACIENDNGAPCHRPLCVTSREDDGHAEKIYTYVVTE